MTSFRECMVGENDCSARVDFRQGTVLDIWKVREIFRTSTLFVKSFGMMELTPPKKKLTSAQENEAPR